MQTPIQHNQPTISNRPQGFTLIELLFLLGFTVMLITLIIPGLTNFVNNQRAATQVNQFVTDLQRARVTAVTRRRPITMCKSTISNACAATPNNTNCSCSTTGTWDQGWVMFIDADDDETIDSGETVLWINEGLDGNSTLDGNTFIDDEITFNSLGQAMGHYGTLVLCPSGSFDQYARAIVISNVGRIRSGYASDEGQSACTL